MQYDHCVLMTRRMLKYMFKCICLVVAADIHDRWAF